MAALLTLAALVALTTSVLWTRSETSRRQAEAQTQRAEAGKLLAIAEREVARDATGALAYVMRSLEVADSEAARLFVLRVLQRAPVARVWRMSKEFGPAAIMDFSPDGRWAAVGGVQRAAVIGRDGRNNLVLGDYPPSAVPALTVRFGPAGDVLAADRAGDVRVWTIPGGRQLRSGLVEARESCLLVFTRPDAFLTMTRAAGRWSFWSWPLVSGEPRIVGSFASEANWSFYESARHLFYELPNRGGIYLRSLVDWHAPPRLAVRDPPDRMSLGFSVNLALSPDEAWLAMSNRTADIRISRAVPPFTARERVLRAPTRVTSLGYDPTGRWLFATDHEHGPTTKYVFDLTAPPGAEPRVLARGEPVPGYFPLAFDPTGRWAATLHWNEVAFWPLDARRAHVLSVPSLSAQAVAFAPDGRSLLWLALDGGVRAWSLRGDLGNTRTVLPASAPSPPFSFVTMHAASRALAVSGAEGRLAVVPLDGGPARALTGFPVEANTVGKPAFSDDGRLVAAGFASRGPRDQKVIRVWNLETGAVRTYGPLPGADDEWGGASPSVWFGGRDRLLAIAYGTGLVSLDLSTGATRVLARLPLMFVATPSRDRRVVVAREGTFERLRGAAFRIHLDEGTAEPLPGHGNDVLEIALDPSGTVVATGSADGTVRVGRVSGGEPHILLGQTGWIRSLAFSPDGRWLAASGDSPKIYIWPVPDVSKVPLHRRTLDELLRVLRTHTNLRAVPDAAAPGGYALKPDLFPGWATLPEW